MAQHGEVWVYTEIDDREIASVSLELLSKGRELADELGVGGFLLAEAGIPDAGHVPFFIRKVFFGVVLQKAEQLADVLLGLMVFPGLEKFVGLFKPRFVLFVDHRYTNRQALCPSHKKSSLVMEWFRVNSNLHEFYNHSDRQSSLSSEKYHILSIQCHSGAISAIHGPIPKPFWRVLAFSTGHAIQNKFNRTFRRDENGQSTQGRPSEKR
jgi:hypothetical protein